MNWKKCFTKDTPERIKHAIKRVYEAYPEDCMPQGVCDPLYIMNVIAMEVGFGDGEGKFYMDNFYIDDDDRR